MQDFLKWGYPNSWMVFLVELPSMDDKRGSQRSQLVRRSRSSYGGKMNGSLNALEPRGCYPWRCMEYSNIPWQKKSTPHGRFHKKHGLWNGGCLWVIRLVTILAMISITYDHFGVAIGYEMIHMRSHLNSNIFHWNCASWNGSLPQTNRKNTSKWDWVWVERGWR